MEAEDKPQYLASLFVVLPTYSVAKSNILPVRGAEHTCASHRARIVLRGSSKTMYECFDTLTEGGEGRLASVHFGAVSTQQ